MYSEKEKASKNYDMGTIISALVKLGLALFLTIFLSLWGYSCNIDESIIKECKSACSTSASQMKAVSSKSCTCEEKRDNKWAIPR